MQVDGTRTTGGDAGAGEPITEGGVGGEHGGPSWERTTTTETATTGAAVTGSTALSQRRTSRGGNPDIAEWNLSENPVRRQGIPKLLVAAVLLDRREDKAGDKFTCRLRVSCELTSLSNPRLY